MPLISVVVPVFKTEEYIEKCLRSIMNQTMQDIEIICVDDCSPDESIKIVESMAQEDSRIRIIRHEKNLGLGGARNTAIRSAQSEYIASVDSDDYIEPGMLEALWNGAEEGKFDIVVCGYHDVDENGNVLAHHLKKKLELNPIPEEKSPFKISNPAFWNKLWRRSLFVDNNIYFPNHIYYQDSATTPRVYKKAKNIKFIGGAYYKYLIRGSSVTNSISDKHKIDKFRELGVVKDFLIDEGLYEQHKQDYEERVINSFKYHAENVANNNREGDKATGEYLRHLLLMREALLSFDDVVRSMSVEKRIQTLKMGDRINLPTASSKSSAARPAQNARNRNSERRIAGTPRVLVLTLFSGENEYEQSKCSLAAQDYENWEQKCFEWMGNAEGHKALYSYIMDNSEKYDLFLKLDADMVFCKPNTLRRIVQTFQNSAELDHLIVGCEDFMTGQTILGVHSFTHRVQWNRSPDGIFFDPSPQRPGRRKIIENPTQPFFQHTPNPSEFQAFHFGAHRALKLCQQDRGYKEKRIEAIKNQWSVLYHTWLQFEQNGDLRHALALKAADLVIEGEIGQEAHDYSDGSLKRAFSRVMKEESKQWIADLRDRWGGDAFRLAYLERAVEPVGFKKLIDEKVFNLPGASFAKPPVNATFSKTYETARHRLASREFEKALEGMRHAIACKPKSKLARVGVVESLIGLGKVKEAIFVLEDLIKSFPKDERLIKRLSEVTLSSCVKPRTPLPL